MTTSETLATWALGLTMDDVPFDVRHAACVHLLDGLGTAISGAITNAAAPAVEVATSLGGPPESAVLGVPARASAPAAALANGTLVHATDFDDTHAEGLVHATAAVLPAAFAVGEAVSATGSDVLLAAIVGYEVACRVASGVPHGFHARGIHATHACATISAAMITSRLIGSNASTTVNAMGIAGSASGGLLEFLATGSSTKQLHPGMASLNGIIAARLAAAGATGPSSVLEGERGLYAALSAHPANTDRVVAGLGIEWETAKIGIKPYPACQLSHAALDAVATVLGQIESPNDVVRVVTDVHPDCMPIVCEPRTMKVTPRTPYDAKFSLPWSVAALIIDGGIGVQTYVEASIARPDVIALAGLVEPRPFDYGGPAATAPGRAQVHLGSGHVLTGSVPHSRGTFQSPMSDSDILGKFSTNCGGSPLAPNLADTVTNLISAASLHCLFDLAQRIIEEQRVDC